MNGGNLMRSILLQLLRVTRKELFITAPDAFYWRLVADAIRHEMAADLLRLLPMYIFHRLTGEMLDALIAAIAPQDAAHLLAFTGERKLRVLGAQRLDRLVEEACRTSKTALLPLMVDHTGLPMLSDAQFARLVGAVNTKDRQVLLQQAAPPVLYRMQEVGLT